MKKCICYLFLLLNILVCSFAQTNDPLVSGQWWLKSNTETGGVNLINAWKIAKRKYTPKVAVIDTGLDVDHEDIKANILVNKAEIPSNGLDDDGNGYIDDYYGYSAVDNNGDLTPNGDHGTHTSGTIVAIHNNRVGIAGTAKYAKLIPIKFDIFDAVKATDTIAEGIFYAIKRGADIINISAGSPVTSKKLENAVKKAFENDIIIVLAAGNSSKENASNYPQNYAKKYSNMIIVASSNDDRKMSSFSNYGKESVHVFAPGSEIWAPISDNKYMFMSGTSMAAPIVTGVVSLVLATHGRKAAKRMRERIINTSHRFETLGGKVYSNGLVDAYNAVIGQYSLNLIWR